MNFDIRSAMLITSLLTVSVSASLWFAALRYPDHLRRAMRIWIGGLLLCAFVGPAQAASRSFLARVTPAGREGEIFGLYATTGRAASWMASGAWTVLIALTSATVFGILGIVLVLLLGFLLLLPVKAAPKN